METIMEGLLRSAACVRRGSYYRLTLDPWKRFEELLRDGRYDDVFPGVSAEAFPLAFGGGVIEPVLLQFPAGLPTVAIRPRLKSLRLQAADTAVLLAFGEQYPDEQRKFVIVGLDARRAFPHGHAETLLLDAHEGRRRLSLTFGDDVVDRWPQEYCFLAYPRA
jgi:hypothetical protein